ncbi:alpha-N-arabinofuranosidase A [Aspergillus steynii IBT 23096]|uniref:non-reducing end alpha-L-arabinofuranosidase n=1 Tax=Aspergillus steynii IBT 23096 TaxID=1392250 RepID=A0A2I2GL05_9EURO|nr:alpha-N-arabinofuranosidase A [Aspergillus steynii IBT 23096]PLB53547.1 alpha-N-arabinofuranosidase A [Aspergillus steynii IBT 23096]
MKLLNIWKAAWALSGLQLIRTGLCAEDASSDSDSPSAVVLNVQKDGGNESSPLLYGIMFEEMDHSGDGGIHGQLLQNNGFQGTKAGLTAYWAIGEVDILQDEANPLSDAITSTLQVQVMPEETDFVGFANGGYQGVPVMNATYRCEFWMKGEYSGPVTLQLVGTSSGTVYASHEMAANSTWRRFTRYETTFNATASPDGDNDFRLLFDGSKVPGMSLNFGLVQLFPPTYHSRINGLRNDLATVLEAIRPSFLRFPGGNNLEGLEIDSRWAWNRTIGPVVDRPGRDSDWFYPNTDALGLDEYLWWCEDMGMEPVLAVWDGKSYGGILVGSDLQPYVDDIMNELEYLLGPSNSTYGRMRAQNGREEPWSVRYIEIGNEDDYTGGCESYPDRFTQIYDAIIRKYPHLTIIASTIDKVCLPLSPPPGILYDYHYYRKPDELAAMFNEWDNQPRSEPVIIGEWGCRNTTAERGVFWSFVQCSCSEAVHMIGMERNSDVVKMSAYTPLLQHFGFTQWSPTLYGFDSSPGSITPSTSYYVQKMFSTNRGTTVLPVNTTANFGPLYWVASRDNGTYYVKLANYGEEKQTVHINVPATRSGRLEMLSGPRDASNQPHNVTIQPTLHNVTNPAGNYTVDLAAWGVAVLAVS